MRAFRVLCTSLCPSCKQERDQRTHASGEISDTDFTSAKRKEVVPHSPFSRLVILVFRSFIGKLTSLRWISKRPSLALIKRDLHANQRRPATCSKMRVVAHGRYRETLGMCKVPDGDSGFKTTTNKRAQGRAALGLVERGELPICGVVHETVQGLL